MARIHNFNAGPAALPLSVLEQAQREFVDFKGTGMSILEHSHRGASYDGVHNEAIARLKALLGIGDEFQVLFLQGGASLQFAMMPMNFIAEGQSADYAITGVWSEKALAEAKRIAPAARAAIDVHGSNGCTRIPAASELECSKDAAYLHLTSNNTIFGTQWHAWPQGEAPLFVDMSSDMLSRPLDMSRFGMIYGGTQKNLGPSGLAIVVVRKELLEQARTDVPNILSYKIHAAKNSLYHTANTFAVYMVNNVLTRLETLGGLQEVERLNRAKAELLYQAIDSMSELYRCPVDTGSRSLMNVVFTLPSAELTSRFLAQATEAGMGGLKGHRSAGGIRASIYNAVPLEAVEALVAFMSRFAKETGSTS